jgi:hypothetical protein
VIDARDFHIGDILSITTEILVSPRNMDGVHALLDWMTGDNLFTHQLPRAARECQGPLRLQHPDLAKITVPDWSTLPEDQIPAAVVAWLAEQAAIYGETRPVHPLLIPRHVDPITELEAMVGPDKVVVARVGDDTERTEP